MAGQIRWVGTGARMARGASCTLLLWTAIGVAGPGDPGAGGVPEALGGARNAVAAPNDASEQEWLEERRIARLRNLYALRIDNKDVTVEVLPLPSGKFAVVLSGTLKDQEAVDKAEAEAKGVSHRAVEMLRASSLKVREKPEPTPTPAPAEMEIAEVWPLSYIAGDDVSQREAQIESMVETLNTVYARPDAQGKDPRPKPLVRAEGDRLWLVGPPREVLGLKMLLATLDTHQPQVQLEMWALQVSGKREQVARQVSRITRQVRQVQGEIRQVPALLLAAVHGATKGSDPHPNAVLETQGPLSMLETLVKLGLADKREEILTKFQERLSQSWRDQRQMIGFRLDYLKALRKDEEKAGREQLSAWDNEMEVLRTQDAVLRLRRALFDQPHPVFPRLQTLLQTDLAESDRCGAARFQKALAAFNELEKKLEECDRLVAAGDKEGANEILRGVLADSSQRNAPEWLARESEMSDRLIKSLFEALAADIHEVYMEPLLQRIQNMDGPNTSGISLAGKTRIVVTDRREAALKPTLTSQVESWRPKPFGKDLFDTAFPALRSSTRSRSRSVESEEKVTTGAEGGQEKPGVATGEVKISENEENKVSRVVKDAVGLTQILGTLPQAQALLLAAALAAEADPERAYTELTPGISVKVTPSVLPDGGSARLKLDFNFGVSTTVPDMTKHPDVRKAPLADAIQSHQSTTDATVSGFDLFDISSFTMMTSHPQTRYYPLLGSLPLIGRAFKQSTKSKETHHESVVLVNAVILPRTLGILRFYKGGPSSATGQFAADTDYNPTQAAPIAAP